MGSLFSICCARPQKKEDHLLLFYNSKSYEDLANTFIENDQAAMNLLFHFRRDYNFRHTYQKYLRRLATDFPDVLLMYFSNIIDKGTYKDFLVLFGTPLEEKMIKHYCFNLLAFGSATLAAKYAPSEKCSYDKKYNAVSKFCANLKTTKKDYRTYISKLRAKLNVIESHIGTGTLKNINVKKIPQHAKRKYKDRLKECRVKQKYISLPYEAKEKQLWGIFSRHAESIKNVGYFEKPSIENKWKDFRSESSIGFREDSLCIIGSRSDTFDAVYSNLRYILKLYITPDHDSIYRSTLSWDIREEILSSPILDTPEAVSSYLVKNCATQNKDRIFLFLEGNTKQVFESINNPGDSDLIFWDPVVGVCPQFFTRDENIHYIYGFSSELLYYLTNSYVISASNYAHYLACDL
jgi:hypothetical protein